MVGLLNWPPQSVFLNFFPHIFHLPFSLYLKSFSWLSCYLLFISTVSFFTSSIQFSSVTQLCPSDPMDCSMPGFPVHHQLSEFAQTHVRPVSDAIQSSHPLASLSSPAFNLSEHQGLFHWVGFSHEVAKVLEFQLQNQSFQWKFRIDFL